MNTLTENIVQIFALIISTFPLAVAAAWSPSRLGVSIYHVSQPIQPLRRGLTYLAGAATALGIYSSICLVLVYELGQGLNLFKIRHDAVGGWLNLILGICLILIAFWVYRYDHRYKTTKRPDIEQSSGSTEPHFNQIFWLGFTMIATSLSTIIFLIPAMNIIGLSSAQLTVKVLATLIFDLIVLLPVILPPLLYRKDPRLVASKLHPLALWINKHLVQVLIYLLGAVGLYLTLLGLVSLVWHWRP